MDALFAGVATRDLSAMQPWYERFFGRPPDVRVSDDEVMWQVTESSWLYLVASAPSRGHSLISIAVDDLRAACDAIGARGLDSRVLENVDGAGRKAVYADPEGNTLTLIEIDTE